jgi:hypothetical protein
MTFTATQTERVRKLSSQIVSHWSETMILIRVIAVPLRVIAIPTAIADAVRSTNKAPRYGHPVHTEVASGYGPCRHCLKTFSVGEDKRTLFTYDPFDGIHSVPLPGPVFIHAEDCARYPEENGYPERSPPISFRARRLW